MSNQGFITLHRKLLDNPIIANEGLFQLFVVLLLMAAHKETKFIWNGKEQTLQRGQLITGRFTLAEKLGVNPNTIYKRLQTLGRMGIVNTKSNNKFTLITIVKYSQYQDKDDNGNTKSNNQVTTKEQQSNTYNNDNNENNVTNNAGGATPLPPTLRRKDDFFENPDNQEKVIAWLVEKGMDESYAKMELAKFIGYWTETNAKGKMRWENEKFFEVKRRLATWFSRANANFTSKPSTGRTRKVIKL